MKLPQLALSFFAVLLLLALLITPIVGTGFAQSRRQPPTSNEKKNKRPGETPGEKQEEPPPPDVVGSPQEAKNLTTSRKTVTLMRWSITRRAGRLSLD